MSNRIQTLEANIRKWNIAYDEGRVEDHPDDATYDAATAELLQLRGTPPATGSPSNSKIRLPLHMGSLDKITDDKSLTRKLKSSECDYVVMDKLDGVSVMVCIDASGEMRAYSRGNGDLGQDITLKIKDIPGSRPSAEIRNRKYRGEVIMPKSSGLTNARAAVSGYLHRDNCDTDMANSMRVVMYEVLEPVGLDPSTQMKYLASECTEVVWNQRLSKEDITFESMCRLLEQRKTRSEYDVDGLVLAKEVTYTSIVRGNPLHAFAFKNPSAQPRFETVVTDVVWTTSRRGRIVPTVVFEGVDISGSIVKRASGHNYDNIQKLGLGIGAVITIKKSGDVIPAIVEVITPTPPSQPPQAHVIEGVHAVSTDGADPAARLLHFFKKIGFKGLGAKNTQKLADAGLITPRIISNSDITVLTNAVGQSLSNKIKTEMDPIIRDTPLATLADASGCMPEGVGTRIMETVIERFGSDIDVLSRVYSHEISTIPGVGDATAAKVVSGLSLLLDFIQK